MCFANDRQDKHFFRKEYAARNNTSQITTYLTKLALLLILLDGSKVLICGNLVLFSEKVIQAVNKTTETDFLNLQCKISPCKLRNFTNKIVVRSLRFDLVINVGKTDIMPEGDGFALGTLSVDSVFKGIFLAVVVSFQPFVASKRV